ncbi:nardilysin-like [Pyrus ussuriensis x Pyrus communis]|uniref:Nardilysin-like n=1 Tax=Pyrus ussuriensis x Pyrus communis TaxID=2448454 RepID=A0A5N5HRJ9_9ROSA|nr:nardilysin-like [Pyrus ussuriensis x Pyrus communis]
MSPPAMVKIEDAKFCLVEVVKEDMKRRLKNTNMKPLSHSSYLRLQGPCQIFYDADEKLHVLDELSISDLKSFILELCSQVHYTNVPIFVTGYCCQFVKLKFLTSSSSRDEAITLSNIFKSNFSVPPLPIELRHKEYVICLPPGANLIRDSNVKNKSETNSVIGLYFQVEQEAGIESIRLKALIDLFDEIVEPLFNQLRTKEQLGYVVECGPRVTYHVYEMHEDYLSISFSFNNFAFYASRLLMNTNQWTGTKKSVAMRIILICSLK